jgi:release factor glutamine methyltransferase
VATVREHIDALRRRFDAAGIEDARLNAELLLAHVMQLTRGALIGMADRELEAEQTARLAELAARRETREPIDYIVGERDFFGRTFAVRKGVLVPRPETELIIEHARAVMPHGLRGLTLDIGTGSGALAVTLACEFAGLRVVATDISAAPVRTARENAARHNVSDRVHVLRCDGASAVINQPLFALIVANPPYVDPADLAEMQPEVRDFEPHEALFAEQEGAALVKSWLPQMRQRLAPGGLCMLEFGAGQGQRTQQFACEAGFNEVSLLRDYAGLERTLAARA